MSLPAIDTPFMLDFLVKLLNIPSPTGYAEPGIAFVEETLRQFPQLTLRRTRKGALVAFWPGKKSDAPRALTAHVDTLGAMVKEIKPNGRLKLTRIGGLVSGGVETEGVTVLTSRGEKIRGSYMFCKASGHTYGQAAYKDERNDDSMEVRLDARTTSADETRALGINVGDFVVFDTRTEVVNGFVRSRFLDDKACVANIRAAVKALHEAGIYIEQSGGETRTSDDARAQAILEALADYATELGEAL